ncbi:MAG: hypothetical protein E7020_04055 [Alphaproteobacteria bacterium]|nr:hypothetical protein [Alphaproteobacteria bacterium]
MVLHLFIALFVIASASILIIQGRRRRIWSFGLLAILACICYFFATNTNTFNHTNFIYNWLTYDNLYANFSIISSLKISQMYIWLLIILLNLILFNTTYHDEYHSLHFNTLLLLNFTNLILLVSSNDFLQLMFASSMFSIITFYMPDIISAKKKIFIFNFLSEMALFMALAIVYSTTNSIDLNNITPFIKNGNHKDLVICLLLFCIASKCGLFLFNGQYYAMKNVSYNRLLSMLLLSVPLSGFILVSKLRPLLDASPISSLIITYWCFISVAIGLGGILLSKSIKSKNISLAMASNAFLLLMIYSDTNNLYSLLPKVTIFVLLISFIFILIAKFSKDENNIFFLTKLNKINILRDDLLSNFYETFFINPLKFLGRILWLVFDIVVIERSIIASISHGSRLIVNSVHKIQETGKWSCLISIVLGFVIMLTYLGSYVYE